MPRKPLRACDCLCITGRQYDKKPPNLARTLSFLSRNLAQTLSFLRPKITTQKKTGGFGGQRPPDLVPGTAEGACGALGGSRDYIGGALLARTLVFFQFDFRP